MDLKNRGSFGSKIGIIAAAAGSAIGLGNIWKFPYITGVHGGAAFLIVYLVCIAVVGVTVMLAEFILGRMTQRNGVSAFKALAPKTSWYLVGFLGILAGFFILSFYSVVAGWTVDYIFKAASGAFSGKSAAEIGGIFGGFISNDWTPIAWHFVFMLFSAGVIVMGVQKGIEKTAKILMPLLLVILLILCVRAVTLPGASKGLAFLFSPNWGNLSGEAILVALGHAFFSLSLGMGTMLIYGSYIQKKENLGMIAVQVSAADTVIAILAGVAIFPAVFAFGIEPGAGPGLVFVTLPNVFNQMPGGQFFCFLFFVLLALAALTSAVSILECLVSYVIEERGVPRKKATIYMATACFLIGIPCSLSMGSMSDIHFLPGKTFFDALDYLSANWFLPLGGMFISYFVGWKLDKKALVKELSSDGKYSVAYLPLFVFICKFIAPVIIFVVFLHGLGAF